MTKGKKSSGKNCFVYVISGKDAPLVNDTCDKLLHGLVPAEERTTGLLTLEADKTSVSEVLDELRTLPFLTTRRVVVLRDADKFISNNRDQLEHYFESPSPTGILVFTVSNFDSRTRLAKKLPEVGQLITVTAPTGRDLPPKISEYAAETSGKKIDAQAVYLLIELLGEDLARLYSEIDKLAVFAADRKQITIEDVQLLIGHNRIYNTFNIIDSVISQDIAAAVDQLRRLFEQDRSAEYTFVGAFAYHLRRMFNAKVMLDQGSSQWDVGKKLRIWHGKEKFFTQLNKVKLSQLGSLISSLAHTDYEIKTGRTAPGTAAEQLVIKLAAG